VWITAYKDSTAPMCVQKVQEEPVVVDGVELHVSTAKPLMSRDSGGPLGPSDHFRGDRYGGDRYGGGQRGFAGGPRGGPRYGGYDDYGGGPRGIGKGPRDRDYGDAYDRRGPPMRDRERGGYNRGASQL
jgi:hypothetical protein